jgi:hypothetical protein
VAHVSNFTVTDLEEFSRVLRTIGAGASDMEEVARRVTGYLYDNLQRDDGTPECLTVTLHKTHQFKSLPPRLQELARLADPSVTAGTACLTRLAQAGYQDPDEAPQALVQPLTESVFQDQPILVALLVAMGLDIQSALDPERALSMGVHRLDFNLFLVPDLQASEWFPDEETRAQVAQLGLQALLGIGGGLPSGDLFLVFWFTYEPISERSADLMRSMATAIKASLIPFTLKPFADTGR